MATQKDVKNRIGSVKNIAKITRAMEMVAAARLRRAEQRIEALRPYARAIRRMTRRTVEAAENIPNLPLLEGRENVSKVGLLLVTGDRGLAGAFNSQILRAGNRRAQELSEEGKEAVWFASGRRGVSLAAVPRPRAGRRVAGLHRPPRVLRRPRHRRREIAAAYVDGEIDRVEIIYNGYVSPLTQIVRTDVLLPLQDMAELVGRGRGGGRGRRGRGERGATATPRGEWLYEPDPGELLTRLIPDFIEISIFRALLESTASEHGARMTAMRNAQENATDMIDDLTLEMNRQRQAEITQEIMEVVAGAEGLS